MIDILRNHENISDMKIYDIDHIDHYAWVTLKTYLPVKRIGN